MLSIVLKKLNLWTCFKKTLQEFNWTMVWLVSHLCQNSFWIDSDIFDILGNRYDVFFDSLIEARRTGKNKGEGKDLLSVLLNFQGEGGDFEEGKLSDVDIKALMLVSLFDNS